MQSQGQTRCSPGIRGCLHFSRTDPRLLTCFATYTGLKDSGSSCMVAGLRSEKARGCAQLSYPVAFYGVLVVALCPNAPYEAQRRHLQRHHWQAITLQMLDHAVALVRCSDSSIFTFLDDLRYEDLLTAPAFQHEECAQIIWIADTRSVRSFQWRAAMPRHAPGYGKRNSRTCLA